MGILRNMCFSNVYKYVYISEYRQLWGGKKERKNESLRKGGNVSDEKICIETSVAEKYTEMKKNTEKMV